MHFDRERDDDSMSANLQGDCDRVFADTVGSGDGVDALVRSLAAPDDQQVWSLTQFYSVDFSKSRMDVKKCVFNKLTIKVCVSCC